MKYYPEPTPVAIISEDAAAGGDDGGAKADAPPPPPPSFEYLHSSPLPPAAVDAVGGCGCAAGGNTCSPRSCPCAAAHWEAIDALADPSRGPAAVVTLLECGPACACAGSCGGGGENSGDGKSSGFSSCGARTTQRGVRASLAVARRPGKGWGLVALAPLPRGAFVCEYAGEPVTAREARARLAAADAEASDADGGDGDSSGGGGGHALLVARLVLPSGGAALRVSYDATRRGNVARFVNHACDGGNLDLVFVTRKGELVPRVALFARREIAAGEELAFSYGSAGSGSGGGGEGATLPRRRRRRCACGTAACRGFLPAEADD